MTSAPVDPMLGRLIDGRYQVRSRIARGGMATVYLATDLRLERRVAIKIMHGHLADDSNFKTRFVQEARSAARLAHPNVVNVFDQGQDEDMAYLVMEYLPGITLRDLLRDYQILTPEQTLDIMESVLAGLASAHKAGIVHRDLKPENVLLADDGRIKLGDFGLARTASANTASGQALLGTIAYLSPELVTRGVADARSDIYAAGIMIFEMLTGEQPFVGEAPLQIAYQHANETVPTPSSRNPEVPVELDEIVLWATARAPEERPHDARELLERLREHSGVIRSSPAQLTPLEPDRNAKTKVISPVSHDPVKSSAQDPVDSLHQNTQIAPASVSALTKSSDRRRRFGFVLFALVLILSGLAAGSGWYFGSGPGAYLAVPSTQGMDPAAASATLQKAGFKASLIEQNNVKVAKGQLVGTQPEVGARVKTGSTVKVIVSLGPRVLAVPNVIDKPTDAARNELNQFTVAAQNQTQFSASVAGNSVIAIVDPAGNAIPATYPEAGPITLVVSLGAVPDVSGLSIDEAQDKLTKAGLAPEITESTYSDSAPKGQVISASTVTDPVRPGDVVKLVVSKGPAPVNVPDVTGKTWEKAKTALLNAGLKLQYNLGADIAPFPTFLTVASIEPGPGQSVAKGTVIKVNFNGF